ncbi:uncharacterized protein LOC143360077 isoform X2 [Halictus rubicundus]|uniref:uncharacterized protein LOC143360077 isoform X2 n=1 Tax=Halictus rubicundus TaxID=77578 RepID=UPI004036283A
MQVSLQKREDVQTTLVALLIPHKGGCPLHHLCRDYHEMAGEEIPWKELGYCSLMKLLESMSNSIQIEFRNNMIFLKGIASNKSKHISKLVSRQKDQKPPLGRNMFKPSRYYSRTIPSKVYIPAEILTIIIGIVNEHPDGVNKEFVLHKVQACMPYTNITMSEMEEQLNRLSHKMYLSNNKYFPALRRPHSVNAKPLVVTVGGEELDNFSDGEGGEDFQFMSPKNVSIVLPTRSPIKVKSTSNFIQESVNATQFKCKSNTMDNSFKKVSVRPETNRSSLYSFYNCNDNAATYTNNHNCEKEEKDNCIESKHAEDLINSRIRFRLEKLIQNNPDGIWCAELPEKYLEEYKISLNYTELGFSSVREFASQLPDIFHCMQIDDTGDFKLYHSKGQIPSNNSKKKQKTDNLAKFHQIYLSDEESEALPMTLTLNTCNQLIPEGIVTIGESVGQLSVADLVSKEKPYVEVVVVEVFTPTFFWIQLRKKQKAFKTFMNDLHNFYVIKHQDYVIPPVILEKGLNCACIYNKIWHRGIIKTVKPDLQVTVMFYDYGTLKTYQPNEVYYLHRMFSILPAQAIPCGLYNVRPYQAAIWSRNATHQFAVRTSSIPLVATVEAQWINEMDNSMLITLTDTLEEEDVHINDWLVEKKLAEHGKMGDKVDMHNLLLYVEENLLHAPEQCYQTEGSTSNAVSDINEKVFANVPLISPQSTFEVQNLKLSSQQELPAEPDKSVNLQDQAQSTTDTFPRVIPQDKPICNQDKNKISPENLIQLWNENLKLQIQISSIFEILFNKAMTKSETDDNSMKNENTLNTMSDTHHFDVNDIQKVGKLSRDLLNDNSNINNYTDFLQYSLKQLNTFCSGITTVEDSNLDKANQLFPNKSAVSRIPPGFETVAPKANLDRSNQFTNTVNTDLPETLKKPASFNIHLKETNPFKADLLNELQKSQEENYLNSGDLFCSKKNQEPVVKHDIAVFKEDNTDFPDTNLDVTKKISEKNPFVYQEYYSTCQLSTPDSTDTNPKFLFTDYPRPNVTKNIGIASNSFSMIHSVNDLHGATNRRETESENRIFPGNYDAYKYTPSYLRNRSQEHEQMQEENVMLKHPSWTITPCTDYAPSYNNSATSTWLPINSFPSPVVTMQDSKSIDEGYLTGPSTSHTLDRLSPLTQRIADPDKYSASAKIRSTSAEDKLVQFEKCYQMYLQSLESEGTETTSNLRPSQNSKFHSVPTDISLDRKVYIKLIELPKRQIHIVHYQKQGWLLMEDFISFTKLPDVSYILDILQILDFPMPFVEVDGAQCSIEFFKSTSCEQQTKDIMHSFDNLCLIPLKSALKLLKKLKVISAQELQDVLTHNKFEIGSITDEIWKIIREYGTFKYFIESRI